MLEDHLESPVTRQRLRSGPAAAHIDGFADGLHRLGYKPISIDFRLRQLAGLTDWMKSAGFGAENLLEGLQASGLSFADIDWRNGRIAVHGKGYQQEWLPLPQDVDEDMDDARYDVEELLGPLNEVEKRNAPVAGCGQDRHTRQSETSCRTSCGERGSPRRGCDRSPGGSCPHPCPPERSPS